MTQSTDLSSSLNAQLNHAIFVERSSQVKALLASGADPNNFENPTGFPPLTLAAQINNLSILILLLSAGARQNITPLLLAVHLKHSKQLSPKGESFQLT